MCYVECYCDSLVHTCARHSRQPPALKFSIKFSLETAPAPKPAAILVRWQLAHFEGEMISGILP